MLDRSHSLTQNPLAMAPDLSPSIQKSSAMASHLLIVDDDPVMLQAFSGMVELRLEGVTIHTCESGSEALKRIGETDYDAIVSDVRMPGMDGFQLMERVFKIRPTTPTLLVTGHGDHDMGVKALNAGAYAFIPKPIDRDFFLAWLKRAIQLRQLSRTVARHTEELEQIVRERTAELRQNNLQLQTVSDLQRESEALYRSMAEAMPQIVYTTRPDGATDYVNQQWVHYTGVPKDKAVKLEWMQALHPEDVQRAEDRWSEAVREGKICETEYRLRRGDGEYRWHLSRAVPQCDEQGRIIKWIGTSTDIHDRKSVEEALRESEDRYKRLVKYSPDAILINRDDRIVFVNEAGLALFCATQRDQLLGKSPFDLFHPDCHPLVKQRLKRLREDGEPFVMTEEQIIRLDGTIADVEVVASTFLDQGMRAIHVVLRDITERKQTEDTVRLRTAQFETLLNEAPLGVGLIDGDFRIRQVNPTALTVFGNIPDLIGRDFDEVIHILWPKAYADGVVERFRHTLNTGEPYVVPERIEERRDRAVRECYEWRIDRIPLPEGRYGVVCYFRDISAQVRAREAIAESEERFRTLADHMSQFAWMADAAGWIFWYNRRWFEYTGTTLEDMQGWGWETVHHPDHVDHVVKKWRRAHETGEPWEDTFPLRGKDGNYRWFLSRALPIRDTNGQIIRWFGTNTDVTEQRAAEEALRDHEQQLKLIADTAPVYIAHCDTEGRYKFVNKGYAERLGVRQEDCLGKHIEEVVGVQAYQGFRRYVDMALAGQSVDFEIEMPYEAIGRRFMHCSYVPE